MSNVDFYAATGRLLFLSLSLSLSLSLPLHTSHPSCSEASIPRARARTIQGRTEEQGVKEREREGDMKKERVWASSRGMLMRAREAWSREDSLAGWRLRERAAERRIHSDSLTKSLQSKRAATAERTLCGSPARRSARARRTLYTILIFFPQSIEANNKKRKKRKNCPPLRTYVRAYVLLEQ